MLTFNVPTIGLPKKERKKNLLPSLISCKLACITLLQHQHLEHTSPSSSITTSGHFYKACTGFHDVQQINILYPTTLDLDKIAMARHFLFLLENWSHVTFESSSGIFLSIIWTLKVVCKIYFTHRSYLLSQLGIVFTTQNNNWFFSDSLAYQMIHSLQAFLRSILTFGSPNAVRQTRFWITCIPTFTRNPDNINQNFEFPKQDWKIEADNLLRNTAIR